MKTILILANFHMGLYKFRKELIEELLKQYDVYIALPDGPYVKDLQEMGCHFIQVEFDRRGMNPIEDLTLLKTYFQIMKEIKPDIVLTYTIKPNIYGGLVCQLLSIPYIANITGFGTAVEGSGWLHYLTVFLYRWGLSQASKVYLQNKSNIYYADQHRILNGSYELIPGSGVNLTYYTPLRYPESSNSIHFLFISRLMKEKGIEHYLEAAETIRAGKQNVYFHVVGYPEDDYSQRLEDLQAKGIILFHGEQADVRPFLSRSHCIVLPTFYPEGMSNVLLEAAASARPLITTDRPGTQETVHESFNGYLIKEQDTLSLVEAMETFINLPHERKKTMGLASRTIVEKYFNRKMIVDSYLSSIELALAKEELPLVFYHVD